MGAAEKVGLGLAGEVTPAGGAEGTVFYFGVAVVDEDVWAGGD